MHARATAVINLGGMCGVGRCNPRQESYMEFARGNCPSLRGAVQEP